MEGRSSASTRSRRATASRSPSLGVIEAEWQTRSEPGAP